jgi:hypothetical protein
MSQKSTQMVEVMDYVQPRVTHDMNNLLVAPFAGDEIWHALESIGGFEITWS